MASVHITLVFSLLLVVPDSHGLSTYKELCSLASDLNQPDLVYKFMNLANHHAMWNSRKVSYSFFLIHSKAAFCISTFFLIS